MTNPRPYHVLLISHTGCKHLKSAWADAEQAADSGAYKAPQYFPGQTVEVVVIHTATKTAVINRLFTGEHQ